MATTETTTAANKNLGTKVWTPYYFKRFDLGIANDGTGAQLAEDGVSRVYNTNLSGSTVGVGVSQNSDVNCSKIYNLVFTNSLTPPDIFLVYKWDNIGTSESPIKSSDREIIYSRITSGGLPKHSWTTITSGTISIDVGINVSFTNISSFVSGDIYEIVTASQEQMNRKKIWHGGISTFLHYPHQEGVVRSTSNIPVDLNGKQITAAINSGDPSSLYINRKAPTIASKVANTGGLNNRISIFLTWNVDSEAEDNLSASDTTFSWPSNSKDTWQLGAMQWLEKDVSSINDMGENTLAVIPGNDPSGLGTSGMTQLYNTTTSGKPGIARITAQVLDDGIADNDFYIAENQYMEVILIIN